MPTQSEAATEPATESATGRPTTVTSTVHPERAVTPLREDGVVPRFATPLVGRDAELAALVAAVGLGAAGGPAPRGHVVVLDGDAGIGKTRLLSELAELARDQGELVLPGPCVDLGDAPPPYLPFREAFGRLATEDPAAFDDVREAYPGIARLLPPPNSGDRSERPPMSGWTAASCSRRFWARSSSWHDRGACW